MLDMTRVADDIIFATHHDRADYLRKTKAERATWRQANADGLQLLGQAEAMKPIGESELRGSKFSSAMSDSGDSGINHCATAKDKAREVDNLRIAKERPRPPAHDVCLELNRRLGELAVELLGKPNQQLCTKNELRYGKKGSLAIAVEGSKSGCWFDHENGVGGDALELICQERRCGKHEALDWARGWLGWPRQWTPRETARTSGAEAAEDEGHEADLTGDAQKPELAGKEEAAARKQKVDRILAESGLIAGTPVEKYLRDVRGITPVALDCIRFRRNAFRTYPAMVAVATTAEGEASAVQQVYLTEQGTKAPLPIVKRTNKAVDNWSEKAAVRFPGKAPLVLAEGVETAMSIWQATGKETWACLGIENIGHAPVPEGAPVIVACDGDEPGSKADQALRKAAHALQARGHAVCIAVPPQGEDFNDVLLKQGQDAVKRLIDGAQAPTTEGSCSERPMLEIGSDVEIAGRVHADYVKGFGEIVHAEGEFWRYHEAHWEPIAQHELRRCVHAFDGMLYPSGRDLAPVRLSKGRIDSILNEWAALCANPNFFQQQSPGINCASGFIRFSDRGVATLVPHDRSHRCRHTLAGHWAATSSGDPPAESLLAKLLTGIFKGDQDADEKIVLLSELCGSAALGYATQLKQPRAAIFYGLTAENGKSQTLDLARGLLPGNAVCSVPASRMGDERHIVGLVGKLLNATDELSAGAIASDTFKSVVTGEPIEGRDVYRSRIEFRSMAQNIFATNTLPPFHGGMDRGVQRRLLVLTFNRTIPVEERVENIGRRIAEEEPDLLLAWAVKGASRLIKERNFTIPESCKRALHEWIFDADPVLAWLDACADIKPISGNTPSIRTREAYDHFKRWAVAEGYDGEKLSRINTFVTRVSGNAKGVEYYRTSRARLFLGLIIRHGERPSSSDTTPDVKATPDPLDRPGHELPF